MFLFDDEGDCGDDEDDGDDDDDDEEDIPGNEDLPTTIPPYKQPLHPPISSQLLTLIFIVYSLTKIH